MRQQRPVAQATEAQAAHVASGAGPVVRGGLGATAGSAGSGGGDIIVIEVKNRICKSDRMLFLFHRDELVI